MVEFNVRLKPSKFYFGMEERELLGHTISARGVKMSLERVQGIRALPEPTSVKAVRRVLGMVNYFKDHIPALSSHLISLYELTKKRSAFEGF
jgi:hypothetical protein